MIYDCCDHDHVSAAGLTIITVDAIIFLVN